MFSYTESGSDSEDEEWAGLTPEPSDYSEDQNYGTPLAAGRRKSGADCAGGSSRKATPSRTPPGAAEEATPQVENIFGRIYRTGVRYYRYGQSVFAAVIALLSIKPYRYLLGGECDTTLNFTNCYLDYT